MAYAALNSLMLTLEQILLDPDRYSFPCGKQHVESLHSKLGYLQEFLEDLSPKNNNEATACFERRIRDLVYDAEDIIDLYLNEILENVDLLIIVNAFDSMIKEAEMIKDKLGSGNKGDVDSLKKEATDQPWNSLGAGSSKLALNLMVGFDDDLRQIKDRLTGHPTVLEVISIVGMGGIGKTTLASNVYNDQFIRRHFDIYAWATVSQSYFIRNVVLSILGSMKNMTDEMQKESDDQLKLHLYQALKNMRYLIIIDDIWDTNAWDGMRRMFPDDNIGSRIILTTRISDVAAYASSSGPLHHMSLLTDDLSWILLCAKVFGKEPCPLNLQELGKKIVKKCRGLPLSIVVIGGLLSKLNNTKEAWQDVAESVTSIVNSTDDQCLKILKLSYNYLPQRLKACFLYLGAFLEDYEIFVSMLTKLWIAEGFVKQGRFPRTLEEEAERYLEELADRSLILVSGQNFDGKIQRFRIHDLLRQLCVNESKSEKFLQVIKWYTDMFPGSSHGQRRTSIHYMELVGNHCFYFNSMPLILITHSLICIGNYSFSSNVFLRFKLLRVLDAIGVKFSHFPLEILELLNLRYIAFMYIGEIPASISKLQNLQTLIIPQEVTGFYTENESVYLRLEIWELHHLRHLEFTSAYLLDPIGASYDRDGKDLVLKDLQTISGIRNLRFTEDMLKRIANIKKLEISYDDAVCWSEEGWSYYHLENLVNLRQLEVLKIFVIPDIFTPFTGLISLPKSFTFPHTLKILTLSGCEIPWKDLAIVSSLPILEVLTLKDEACSGKNWEPNDGGFCKLKILELEDLDLKYWKADHNSFPSLEHLILRHCYDLVEIPCEMGESPTLKKIEVDVMNKSLLTSAQKIKEMQEGLGNDDLQVVLNLTLNGLITRHAACRVWKNIEQLTYEIDNPIPDLEQSKDPLPNYCICFVLMSCPEYAEIAEKFYETFISAEEIRVPKLLNIFDYFVDHSEIGSLTIKL